MNPEEYFRDLTQDILALAGAEENFTRSTFLDFMCSKMEDEGFISGYDLTEHKISSKGQAVDAWAYDPELSKLTLFIGDYRSSESLETLTKTELDKLFKRLRKFVDASLSAHFAESLEEADPVSSLAYLIKETRNDISIVSLVVLSNAQLSSRVDQLPDEPCSDFQTTYDVWDLNRIFQNETSGRSKEDVVINFSHLKDGGLPCLPAFTGTDSMQSYLLVMPGSVLAGLYQNYGERLLEQNVRTFLQFRGKINKGIKNTIVNEPEMFFAFNNGLSATAESVTTSRGNNCIVDITNMQIVNGGQTTASIFTALRKDKANLEKVYVQIKLSVIEPERVDDIVPRISEYSNTQNKVSAADFFSNHPFHLRIEEFSRRMWAPSPDGEINRTHWFYERTRGQFANQQANLTTTQKRKFLAQNPRSQMFTKTDLAKYFLSFEGAALEVVLGAQKAFAGGPRAKGFVGRINETWEKHSQKINEVWFKEAIAKAITFKNLDRYIFQQPWYGGYKAQTVTYTLSAFTSAAKERGKQIDFLSIWESQQTSLTMIELLGNIAEKVNDVILNPPQEETQNSGEWAKKTNCWDVIKEIDIDFQVEHESLFLAEGKRADIEKQGTRTQTIQDGIHAQTYVVEKGGPYWEGMREWNHAHKKLNGIEMGVLNTACSIPRKIPSDKQSKILINAEKKAIEEGFYI